MYSFSNIGSPSAARRYLRTDWSKEEGSFLESVRTFQSSVEPGNPIVAPYQVDPTKWPECANDEKKSTCRQEAAHVSVESFVEKERLGTQCHGDPAPQPAQPEESTVPQPQSDSLDDFLFSKESPKTDPPKDSLPLSDPFDDINASAHPAPLSDETAAPVPTSANNADPDVDHGIMEGFDTDEFADTKKVADKILADTGDVDLGLIVNKIPEYGVRLNLDAHRENPNILADSLVEIQAKKDSVHADLLKVTPIADSLKRAIDYILDVGIQCSKQSSREKRIAQVKHEISDLITRYAIMERVRDVLDMTYRHLVGQHETVSRLVTWHSQFPKTMERSFMSVRTFGSGGSVDNRVRDNLPPAPAPAPVPPPQVASPKLDESLFGGLDSMPSEPKVPPKPDKFSKGEIDW